MADFMRFKVVGGADFSAIRAEGCVVPDDVYREARRRRAAAGCERYAARHRLTGMAAPKTISYLAMQIDFVAKTLASLEVIPADFERDFYWPTPAESD